MNNINTRGADFSYMQQVAAESKSKASPQAINEAKEELIEKKRKEIKSLHMIYSDLYKVYKSAKPTSLNKVTLKSTAKEIKNKWSDVEAKLMVLLKYDVVQMNHFAVAKEKVEFDKIKKKQNIIKDELLEVMHYWDYIAEHGKLPKGLFNKLKKFNKKSISHPFHHMEEEEMYLLRKIISRI